MRIVEYSFGLYTSSYFKGTQSVCPSFVFCLHLFVQKMYGRMNDTWSGTYSNRSICGCEITGSETGLACQQKHSYTYVCIRLIHLTYLIRRKTCRIHRSMDVNANNAHTVSTSLMKWSHIYGHTLTTCSVLYIYKHKVC